MEKQSSASGAEFGCCDGRGEVEGYGSYAYSTGSVCGQGGGECGLRRVGRKRGVSF